MGAYHSVQWLRQRVDVRDGLTDLTVVDCPYIGGGAVTGDGRGMMPPLVTHMLLPCSLTSLSLGRCLVNMLSRVSSVVYVLPLL